MDFTGFLAMTGAEIEFCHDYPSKMAYMSCHFSPYGTGLSAMPPSLPPDSMVMLTDRTPLCGHDPARIAAQLAELAGRCAGVILDLQRQSPEAEAVVDAVLAALPCPVIVSVLYGVGKDCPVLLPPPPLWTPLKTHLQPWAGRSIWLEAATEQALVTVTEKGSRYGPTDLIRDTPFTDETLHVRYSCRALDDRAEFFLQRDNDQLEALLNEAKQLGTTEFLGLYQQLK